MKTMMKQTILGAALLLSLAACESRTASLPAQEVASIQWDVVAATDQFAYAPKNANLIQMR